MLKTVTANPWVRAGALVACLVALALLCYVLKPVLVPLFFAFLVAYTLDPVIDFFEVRRIRREISIGVFAVTALLVLLAIPLLLIPSMVSQSERLIAAASQGATGGVVTSWADRLVDRIPLDALVRELGWAPEDAKEIDARAILAERVGTYVKENAVQLLKSSAAQVAGAGQWAGATAAQVLGSLSRGTAALVMFLGNFVVFAFVAGYLLRDFDTLVANAHDLIPPKWRPQVVRIVKAIDAQIHGFLRGQVVVCACLGSMYIVGLLISGVPFAVLLGLFGGVASFVPYLGVSLTILPALFLALLQHGADWHLIAVLATFGIANSIEGTLLTPKIVGEQVGLNPVWVILAIMVFGSLLGFLGMLLAVPIAAALKVLVMEGVAYYRRSSVFSEEAGGGDSESSG